MVNLAKFRSYDWSSHTPRPLDPELNAAIVAIASCIFPAGFDVADSAPDTYEELKAHLGAGHRMVVWSGASDATIYGCPEVNWAFRAWHDWCHWQGQHDFTLEGEAATAELQCEQLLGLFGDTPRTRRWQRIIQTEIIEQGRHLVIHGAFPGDQRAFVLSALRPTLPLLSFAA